jgi:hypothetical protein
MESRSGVENPGRYKPLYGRQSVEHIACGLHRQDRVNSVAVYTNISSRDQSNPCREQCKEKVSSGNHMSNKYDRTGNLFSWLD